MSTILCTVESYMPIVVILSLVQDSPYIWEELQFILLQTKEESPSSVYLLPLRLEIHA